MKKKKVFKTIATHMLTQKKASQDRNTCLYRDGYGLSCAIGILINDDNYSKELEGYDITDTRVSTAVANSLGSPPLNAKDRSFLGALQDFHDYSEPQYWRGELDIFSMKHFKKDLEDIGVSV